MRSLSIFALLIALALPSLGSAGSIRPTAVVTTTEEDTGIKPFMRDVNGKTCESYGQPKSCSQAEVTAAAATCENTSLPPECTQAEATAAAIALGRVMPVIYPLTQAGLQDYGSGIWAQMVRDWLKQGAALKVSKQLPEAFLALSPADQAKVLALMPSIQ